MEYVTSPNKERHAALVVSSTASFLTPFMGSSVFIALPSIGRETGLTSSELGWVVTIFLLTASMFLVPFGRLADIYGRKRIFVWGMASYALTSLLCALSSTASTLLVARALQGIGSGMLFSTSVAIVTSAFPPQERGRALGINVAAVYLGLSLGPVLGGILTEHLGWRSVFVVNAAAGAVVVAMSTLLRNEWAEARGERFDVTGSLLYALSVAGVMYGLKLLPRTAGFILVMSGGAALVAFIRHGLTCTAPVLDLRLFMSNRLFALSNIAALVNYSATFGASFLMSLYLQDVLHLGPHHAGTVMLVQPMVMALLSPLAGRLSDRIDATVLASSGMAVTTAGLAMLGFIGRHSTIAYIGACQFVLGLGFALFSSPNTRVVMDSVGKRSFGIASAMLATMRLTGQTLSMALATTALDAGRTGSSDLLTSLKASFLVFAALCALGTLVSGGRRIATPTAE